MTITLPTTERRSEPHVDEPFFIVASERSGTTLLRLMLDSHPRLSWCHEFSYAVAMVADNGNRPELDEYHEYLDTLRVFQSSGFEIDRSLGYDDLLNSFLLQRLVDSAKPLVGANVHSNAHRLPLLWPEARYIHLVRDGRDVAASCVRQGWYGSYWRAGAHWRRAEEQWDQLCKTVPSDRRLEVAFSDLLLAPEATLTAICEFIGVGYTEDLYSYVETTDYTELDSKHLNKWARQLSPEDVGLIEAGIGTKLTDRGFEPSGYPVPTLHKSDIRREMRLDRRRRLVARVREYGVGLTAAEMLFRFARVKPLLRRCRLRMNAVEMAGLKKSW